MTARIRFFISLLIVSGLFVHAEARAGDEPTRASDVTALVIAISGMKGGAETKLPGTEEMPVEMTPVYGKPMICWVLEALRSSRRVRSTVVVGDDNLRKVLEGMLKDNEKFVTAGGKLSDRLAKGSESIKGFVLIVPPDLVLITPEGVDGLIEECSKSSDVDMFYPVLKKKICVGKYPWEKRTYARFKDGIFTGAHVMVFGAEFLNNNHDKVVSMYLSRRSPLKMMKLLGFRGVLRFLFRRLRLRMVVDAIEKKYDCRTRYIITDDVDLATDFSSPSEMKHVEKVLKERSR